MFKYFKESEFKCKCGCGKNNISPLLVVKIEAAREIAGIPFKLISACRCIKWNKEVGGSDTSSHPSGLAIDIKAKSSQERFKILSALVMAGFNRIGMGKNFIHADIDSKKVQSVIWLY